MSTRLAGRVAGFLADLLIIAAAGFFTVIGIMDVQKNDDLAGVTVLYSIVIVLGLTPLCIQMRIAPVVYRLARRDLRMEAAQNHILAGIYISRTLNWTIIRAVAPWAAAVTVLSMQSLLSSYYSISNIVVTSVILTMGFISICVALAGVGDLMAHLFRSRTYPSPLWSVMILFWSGLAVAWPAGIMYGAEALLRHSENAIIKIAFVVGWLCVIPAMYLARSRWKAAVRECYNFR